MPGHPPRPPRSTLTHPRHIRLLEAVRDATRGEDLAHDELHVLRVYRWAVRLAPEAGVEVDLAGATALVHDLVNIPKDHPDRPLGGEQSALASRGLLQAAEYRPEEIGCIVEAVRTSSWSRGHAPTSMLGAVLQDADRLDAIGAIGIARTFATAQAMASRGTRGRFYDPGDPVAKTDRTLDDRRQAIDHFRVKLLGLAAGMHLPGARAEARRRHQVMESYLTELEREVRHPDAEEPPCTTTSTD
ncbi:MAG: HD domain-containing protein [Myxococcota bacterium]|jgi:uncharacterized protein|nr:HD domain-containing protein [Myxococcota bacterium]